jgi:hypothetical protein
MIADTVTELVDALEAAGLRVAVRAGDITPPAVFVQVGNVTDAGGILAGGLVATFYVHLIPIRGIDNLAGDAQLLDTLLAVLRPLAVAQLVCTRTTVTINNDTWPCYRADLPALAVDPLEVS